MITAVFYLYLMVHIPYAVIYELKLKEMSLRIGTSQWYFLWSRFPVPIALMFNMAFRLCDSLSFKFAAYFSPLWTAQVWMFLNRDTSYLC
jgi:hypothetical protein